MPSLLEENKIAPIPGILQEAEESSIAYDRLFKYDKAKNRIKRIVDDWCNEESLTEENRAIRHIEIDIPAERASGRLKHDETIIPIRVADENIREEQPQFLNFLTQSKRLVIFKDNVNPRIKHTELEESFARGMRYDNWISPWLKMIDGAQTHGWDSVEIEFDIDKPFHLGLSHIGHENLVFDLTETCDIEDCEEIFRKFDLSILRFEELSKKLGFNQIVVDTVLRERLETNNSSQEKYIKVYKRWHKYQGVVYVSWFIQDQCAKDLGVWLKPPAPLYLGDFEEQEIQVSTIDPILGVPTTIPQIVQSKKYETEYPVKLSVYIDNEEDKLKRKRGRISLDKSKQEAQTLLWSFYVNGCARASNIYASPKAKPNSLSNRDIQVIDLKLQGGLVYSEELGFWSPPYPALDVIRATNALDVRTKAETGNISSSSLNRQDSRKTAREIQAAEQKEISLSTIQIVNFSTVVTSVYKHIWRLARAFALQELIHIIPNIEELKGDFTVLAAGDIDYVARQEKIQKRLTVFPLVAQTPLAEVFVLDILNEMFPEDIEKYIQVMEQNNAKDQLINALVQMLGPAITDESGKLKKEFSGLEGQINQLEKQIGVDIISNQPVLAERTK